MFVHEVCAFPAAQSAGSSGKEATMELMMRLNVVAAVMSFAFLAAIVFGMV